MSTRMATWMLIWATGLAGMDVAAMEYYVRMGGQESADGETWENAVASISNAVAKATSSSDIVNVSNGTYTVSESVSVGDITVRGIGPGETIVEGNGSLTNAIFILGHADALLQDVVVTNGNTRGVYMSDGTLRRCVITQNTVGNGEGAGIYMLDGTVDDCDIVGNDSTVATSYESGGIRMEDGLVTNCVIRLNTGKSGAGVKMNPSGTVAESLIESNTASIYGGGVSMAGTPTVRDCIIRGNTGGGGGVYQSSGGVVERCVIVGNRSVSGRSGGGSYMVRSGAVMKDCLLANNYSYSAGGGVQVNNSHDNQECSVLNCTIVSNTAAVKGGGIGFDNEPARMGGVAANLIVYYNEAPISNDIASTRTILYSCSPDLADGVNGCTTDPPLFRNRPNDDYHLTQGSPCRDTGTNGTWVGALDLDREPRTAQNGVDMGAYELPSASGTAVLIQ